MEKVAINKKQEILALSLSILRLCPLYLKYHRNKATVAIEWEKEKSKVTLTYTHHEILLYKVEGVVNKEDDKLFISLELLEAPKLTDEEQNILRTMRVMTDFYELLGVITRKTWMNNQNEDDTDFKVKRSF